MIATQEKRKAPPQVHTRKHLAALGCKDGDRVFFRAFAPKGSDGKSAANVDGVMPDIPFERLQELSDREWGVYLVVNGGGHTDADINQFRAIFYEHDDLEKELSKDLWQSLSLPQPTVQVDTGGKSIHSYWVFDEPLTNAEQWRQLQTDLLTYASADPTLKNPSRVMRLAGFSHAGTGQLSALAGGNGVRYSYAKLRGLIPARKESDKRLDGVVTWPQFNESFRYPITEAVPLELCLPRDKRDWIANGHSELRNDNGFKLAVDLLATSAQLVSDGQRFDGEPYDLFMQYCRNCRQGEGWSQAEWDTIWKSAQKKARNSSLPPEMLENCVKGWAWSNVAKLQQVTKTFDTLPQATAELQEVADTATDEEKLRVAIANYIRVCDTGNRFQSLPLQVKIAKDFHITRRDVDELAKELDRGQSAELRRVEDSIPETIGEIEMRSQSKDLIGVPSGFYDLDVMTGGFQRSDLIIAAGRPSMGKTALIACCARNVSVVGKLPTAIFSMEMSARQINYRLLSAEAQIDSGRLRMGNIRENEWGPLLNAADQLGKAPIYVDDTPNLSVAEISAKLRRLKKHEGQLGVVMIDYLQLMSGDGDNRNVELSGITRALKGLARDLDVPVIALSQLSREVEKRNNKRPISSDIRDSGGVEQDADLIMMLYRDEYYDPDTIDRGIAEIIITKHRNGPIGTVRLLFEPQFTLFRNLARA